ncbi:hypothetical protein EDD21DRAFT_415123 [Dissophora ornata]|nr:hypothetical protein EDD21DRAFT_415123 [Dissophora ornata]
MPGNLQSSIGSSLPSTDPDDASYCTDQDLRESTSKLFTWNYLEGGGRLDSHVDNAWIIDDIVVGRDLMDFRDRVVQENGGLTGPYEKLQGGELHIPDEAVTETHRWAHRLAQNNSEAFLQILDDSPPQNRTLRAILTVMTVLSADSLELN